MLQGYVDIAAHLGVRGHKVEQVFGEVRRIGIVYPYPFDALYPGKRLRKACEAAFPVEVESVVGRVLGYQYQFPDPAARKSLGFPDE